MTKGEKLVARIEHLSPCISAHAWLQYQTSAQQAWDDCKETDWMLWLLASQITSPPFGKDRKPLLACCLDIAETVKHLWPVIYAPEIKRAVAVLRNWIDGEETDAHALDAVEALLAIHASVRDSHAMYSDAVNSVSAIKSANLVATVQRVNTHVCISISTTAIDTANCGPAGEFDARLAELSNIVRSHFPKPPKIRKAKS